MPSERLHDLADIAATHALAAQLAAELGEGGAIGLVGELGAGKTEFVRGLAAALGVPEEGGVCSPSYLLLNLYEGRKTVAHYDAYFMEGIDDIERAGLNEHLKQGAVVVVEWADRVQAALPDDTRWVHLGSGAAGPGSRRARVMVGAWPEEWAS